MSSEDPLPLIARFQQGDQTAFEGLVRLGQDRVYALCRRLLGNAHEAEDAAQDTFVKVYRNLGHFTPQASFSAWLYRIAVNTCHDYRKRPFFAALFVREADEACPPPELSHTLTPERLLEARQGREAVETCLQRLPPKLREVIVLKEMEGLSYEEMALVLDISLGTVKSRLSRARMGLLALMKK